MSAAGPSDRFRAEVAAQQAAIMRRQRGGASAPPPVVQTADPLACPYTLPSRGVFYPGHDGKILIAPTRGGQEEVLSAAAQSDQPEAKLAALRYLTEQCFNLRGLEFSNLLIQDWQAAMIQFLAICVGTDEVAIQPYHKACKQSSDVRIKLAELPQIQLRRAESGEEANWPVYDIDESLAMLVSDIEGGEARDRTRLVAADFGEPFKTPPLPHSNAVIEWRMLRISDLVKTEEFVSKTKEYNTKDRGSPLHTYLQARHIVSINGKKVSIPEAMAWIKAESTPALNFLRNEFISTSFGYETEPWVRCGKCGGMFQTQLELDEGLFRKASNN